ncbi:MAG: hypothetical protein EBS90_13440, partial [Betaproteobacteria bacterium]|nr:hypothetical protein [Betaproteobacteria bacterium]
RAAAFNADLVLLCCRTGFSLSENSARLKPVLRDAILALTKCDLTPADIGPPNAIHTSARTSLGIDALAAAIVRRLVPEEHDDPMLLAGPVPFTARQVELLG